MMNFVKYVFGKTLFCCVTLLICYYAGVIWSPLIYIYMCVFVKKIIYEYLDKK
jgi:hypothetical protein